MWKKYCGLRAIWTAVCFYRYNWQRPGRFRCRPPGMKKLMKSIQTRKKAVEILLQSLGCQFSREQSGLFVWARVPEETKDGYALSDLLLYQANVFVTPGGIFGSAGDKYIRLSLCASEEKILECSERLEKAGIFKSTHHV